MSIIDHLFVIVLAVIYPIVGYISFKRLMRRIDAGETVRRSELYLHTMAGHWTLFIAAMLIWHFQDRTWSNLGFGSASGTGFLVGVGLTAMAIVLLLVQWRQVAAADQNELAQIRGRLGSMEVILPRNGNELGRFYGLSLTAGIVEETLWRGYLIWYLSQFMPLWAAALISTIGFGLGHAYQGSKNLPKIMLLGAVFTGLFILTGSLWLPIFLHAAVDILQGRLAYDIMRRSDNGPSSKADQSDVVVSV